MLLIIQQTSGLGEWSNRKNNNSECMSFALLNVGGAQGPGDQLHRSDLEISRLSSTVLVNKLYRRANYLPWDTPYMGWGELGAYEQDLKHPAELGREVATGKAAGRGLRCLISDSNWCKNSWFKKKNKIGETKESTMTRQARSKLSI